MDSSIHHFLLVFDHRRNKLIRQDEFDTNVDRATSAYAEAEEVYRDDPLIDIVLVGSDSIETVQKTHATYFESSRLSAADILRVDPMAV